MLESDELKEQTLAVPEQVSVTIWSQAMLKQLFFATTLFSLVAVPFTDSSAEEMTLEKALEAWSFLEGEWDVFINGAKDDTITFTKSQTGDFWILESPKGHGIFGFDGSEKKMLSIGAHEGGGITTGHWMPTDEGVIEGNFTLTKAKGEEGEMVSKHTGKFVVKSGKEFTYTLDGDVTRTFKKK